MKKLFSILVVGLLFVSVASAQKKEVTKVKAQDQVTMTSQDAASETMMFESKEIDYGIVEQGGNATEKGVRYFNFVNQGQEPIVIKSARGSCGCTVPEYPKEPILGGESAQIKVKYDINRPGPFTKYVTLTTNVPGQETVKLTIKGKVEKKAPEAPAVPLKQKNAFNNGSNN